MSLAEIVPEGYYACRRCGKLVVEGYQHAASQTCTRCVGELRAEARDPDFAFEVEGRTFRLKPKAKAPARAPARDSEARRVYIRRYRRAEQAAYRRLKIIHHQMYQLLLAEEKAKVGLDPVVYWSADTFSHSELRDLLRERDEALDTQIEIVVAHDRASEQ